ncbi:MAG: glycosyltransferase [Acidobacteria bacterium]|nr:glycosyltransferase [Acidobacteriota bacterium]
MNDRIRVLNLRDAFVFGGPDATLLGWCGGLDRGRFETAIACFENPGGVERVLLDPATDAGLRTFTVPWGPRKRVIAAVRRVVDLIRRHQIDVLHTHDWKADLVGLAAARIAGIPAMTTVYVWFGRNSLRRVRFYEWLDQQVIRHMDLVTAISDATRRDTVARGIPTELTRTLFSGVDVGRFDRPIDVPALRASLGIPEGHQVVGYLARLYPEKAHAVLLAAAHRVLEVKPDVTFLLVGGGPLADSLRAEADALGIGPHVVLTGTRQDVPDLLQVFDVQSHASYAEGIPLALYEGMAAARPVVGSNVDGIPEVVIHGKTGLLVPPGDPGALADGLIALLSDPVRGRALGRAGRQLIEERFGMQRILRELESTYATLAGRRTPGRAAGRWSQDQISEHPA